MSNARQQQFDNIIDDLNQFIASIQRQHPDACLAIDDQGRMHVIHREPIPGETASNVKLVTGYPNFRVCK